MSSEQYPHEGTWHHEEWPLAAFPESDNLVGTLPVELVAILLALFIAVALGWGALGLAGNTSKSFTSQPLDAKTEQEETTNKDQNASPLLNPEIVVAPYDQYVVTQGLHGMSYGHMAIDIAAGKDASIKSPINGRVSEYFIDAIGNPTLVIENDHYRVTLLHGIYSVRPGNSLNIGDLIGTESNQGNTRDMQGRSCRNRDCGYHTHLNIFNKSTQSNIDPLTVISSLSQ